MYNNDTEMSEVDDALLDANVEQDTATEAKGVAISMTSTTWALLLFYWPSQEIIIQMVTHFASLTSRIIFISHNVSLAVHYMQWHSQGRARQGPGPPKCLLCLAI